MKFRIAIFDSDNWREIGATLSRNKTRTFLTAFGIFWGTAMLAMLHGGAIGMSGMLMRQLKGFSTNMGAIGAGVTSMPYKGYNKGMAWNLTLDDIDRIKRTSDIIDLVSPVVMQQSNVNHGDKVFTATLLGVGSDYFRIQSPVILAGRLINEADNSNMQKNAVIGKNISDKLFGVDPQKAIGKHLLANGSYYRVIGVVAQRSEASLVGKMDDSVIVPAPVLALAYNTGKNVDMMIFTAVDGHTPTDVFEDAHRAIRVSHPIHPNDTKAYQEFDISRMFTTIQMVFTGVDLLALFVGLGTLLAGVIGVGNIMWIIVRERTSEIGIRRAIGAKPRQIIAQVLSESIILTAIAGIAGVTFAVGVLAVTDKVTFDDMTGSAGFQLTFVAAVTILVVFLTLGTVAGLIPATKAMRIRPVEAMHAK